MGSMALDEVAFSVELDSNTDWNASLILVFTQGNILQAKYSKSPASPFQLSESYRNSHSAVDDVADDQSMDDHSSMPLQISPRGVPHELTNLVHYSDDVVLGVVAFIRLGYCTMQHKRIVISATSNIVDVS